ncbi:MAG: MarR family winged helix-turn-helix transcriptional regulator [Pirellulales bacterium]|nr:MarR family winged helix-turn-helix transcriptional regulator [Pirellulales bacterium]
MANGKTQSEPTTAPLTAGQRFAPWGELVQRATQCSRLLRAALAHRAEAAGLGDVEFCLLWNCQSAVPAGLHQNQLAAELGVSAAQISALVERLQQRGLIAGHRDPRDRRRQVWLPTSQGRQLLDAVLARLEPWLADAERHVSAAEVRELGAALRHFQIAIKDPGAPALRIVSLDHEVEEAQP